MIKSISLFLIAQFLFFASNAQAPDYNDLQNWAAHPWKEDNSDRVPKDLQQNFVKDSVVDVFFLHPTSLVNNEPEWNASLADKKTNNRTDNMSMLYQASIFNESARVYAPRYRQANLKAYYTTKKDSADAAFALAYEDVRTAFQYYLEHWNNGRPFIIASHSQGTQHAGQLIKEFVEGKTLHNRLVMAYLVGMPVHEDYFTTFKPCADSLQTGCFASWRTYLNGYDGEPYIAEEKQDVIVTNPLTWNLDDEHASHKLNKGGVLYKFDKVVPQVTDAQKHGNILWAGRPRKFGSFLIRMKNYHIADYNLFYVNVREDVARRIRYFWKD